MFSLYFNTSQAWGLNFIVGVIQDIFFIQLVKVYIVNVASLSAMR